MIEVGFAREIGLQRETHEQRLQQVGVILISSKGFRRGRGPDIAIFKLDTLEPVLKLQCVKVRATDNGKNCGGEAILFALRVDLGGCSEAGGDCGEDSRRPSRVSCGLLANAASRSAVCAVA